MVAIPISFSPQHWTEQSEKWIFRSKWAQLINNILELQKRKRKYVVRGLVIWRRGPTVLFPALTPALNQPEVGCRVSPAHGLCFNAWTHEGSQSIPPGAEDGRTRLNSSLVQLGKKALLLQKALYVLFHFPYHGTIPSWWQNLST